MLSIYKASAGSGKTFTLAYEYIKLLLGQKDPESGIYSLNNRLRDRHRHILAVTFTNKATDEMKKRIIHELAVLAGIEPGWTEESPYLERLCRELHCEPPALRKASANALRQLMFDFNSFQVSTIDSFFQTILRTFAREVDIAGNYEVDLDSDSAISQGVRDLFDSLVTDSGSKQTRYVIHWITHFLLDKLNSGQQISLFNRGSNVHSGFLKFIKNVSNDVFAANYRVMMDYLSDSERLKNLATKLTEAEEVIRKESRDRCSAALRLISDRGYDTHKTDRIKKTTLDHLAKVAAAGDSLSLSAKSIHQADADISRAFTAGLAKAMATAPDEELLSTLAGACHAVTTGDASLRLLMRVRANLFVLGLLERVYFNIDRYRNENNTIFLSDTNSLLRDIIGDDDAPFVYERVGVWINHFLIDEFQDTSRLQWENLRPLLHEGQASGSDSLIIGDEKQCIYRFRFSDPTLLQNKVQQEFGMKSTVSGNDAEGNTNWRSSADVVDFNNRLFSTLARTTGMDDIYANVSQRISPQHVTHRGYVKVTALPCDTADQFSDMTLDIMVSDIVRQLRSGYRPCDIAILVRFNREGTAAIDRIMEQATHIDELKDVRIMSDDAMLIESAPAVRLIVSVMRFLALSGDSNGSKGRGASKLREIRRIINRYEHLQSRDLTPEHALALALSEKTDGQGKDITDSLGDNLSYFNVPSLVERIVVRYISPETAESQNMYISAFIDLVTEFCTRGTADLQSFLNWWDDQGHTQKVAAPFDEQAIRVMTIHKSKGLEFSCVHIPFVNWSMVDFRDFEWFMTGGVLPGIDADLVPPMLPLKPEAFMEQTIFADQYRTRVKEQTLDELNVLYVALTRAVDELSICYPATAPARQNASVSKLLAEAVAQTGLTPDESAATIPGSTVLTAGLPTVRRSKKKRRTALEPGNVTCMCGYSSLDRDDLWGKLDIDRYLDYGKACDRGILLHDVLARVRHTADLEKAVSECCRHGRLPMDERDEVIGHLSRQLSRAEIQPWFEGYTRMLAERPLVLADGTTRRPDRVVWTASGHTDVIDYKFGDERPDEYALQVKEYMNILEDMGAENVRGFIWYVDKGDIVAVD